MLHYKTHMHLVCTDSAPDGCPRCALVAFAPQDVLQPCQLRPLVQQPCFSALAQAPEAHGRSQILCSPLFAACAHSTACVMVYAKLREALD